MKTAIGGRSLGAVAFAICVLDQMGYWGATITEIWTRGAGAQHHWQYHSWSLMAMLAFGLVSVAIAVAGLVFDSRRGLAAIALFLCLTNVIFCAMPFLAV